MASEDSEIKNFIHGLNSAAFNLNKGIVQKSTTMQDIKLHKDIYGSSRPKPPPAPAPQPQTGNPVQQQVTQQQVNTDPALLNSLIERVSGVEKQITKFVNLIERRVAKNAKEIHIRIKLDNDSTDTE